MDPALDLPLFPLHTVLCPGVALPLHIFEERYRLMVGRCIERREPFGVVLIREGRDVGPVQGRIAGVGTTAVIRQAGRYADGRLDIVTIGERRFHVDQVHRRREPYLVADVELLPELVGDMAEAIALVERVGRRFIRYLELLHPALAEDPGPAIEIEVEVESVEDAADAGVTPSGGVSMEGRLPVADIEPLDEAARIDTASLTDDERRRLLLAAAERLMSPADPTATSYLLTGLVQVPLPVRQDLLEAPDTVSRLAGLDRLLAREIGLLSRKLKPLALDPRLPALRRN
jgi:Lon protease-like protein